MDSVIELCKEQVTGWYDSIDRLRVGGVLRSLQQAGSVVNFMKLCYPGRSDRCVTSELTQRLKSGVMSLVGQGVPYLEATRVSDEAVQAWLGPLYAAGPRAGSLVAIVRTIEHVSSFSCRPRKHKRAKGHPTTGRRTVKTAEHHLTRARHKSASTTFRVRRALGSGQHSAQQLRAVRGQPAFERARLSRAADARQRRQITMAENAVAKVADWEGLRQLAEADLEPAVRRFGAYWIARLPHGLTAEQLEMLGDYYWYLQVLEVSRNFVFRSTDQCRPVFETLLLHNQLLGSPDTIRYLFGMIRGPRRPTSSQLTLGTPMGCFKAFTAVIG